MLEILLDVNGWQNLFDFKSGEPIDDTGKSYLDLPKRICECNPYPGDTNPDTIEWTTNLALRVADEYDPRLMVLSYATGNIMRVNTKMSDEEQSEISKHVLSEAFRFAKTAGYEPIIVSTGNLKHFDKVLNTDDFELYFNVASDPYMAGVFGASENDFETAKNLPGVVSMTRDEFIAKYNISDEYALLRTPDIVLFADEDTAFTNTGNRGTTYEMIAKKEKTFGVYTELSDLPESIFDFRAFVDRHLEAGEKIAVIITESVDDKDMPEGTRYLSKFEDGIYYMENVSFYYALLNSKRFYEVGMPYIYHNPFLKKRPENRYPFSYIKTDFYQDPIGFNRDFKTASVGTRSGIFHSACMCDYSFECHCRGLAESGLLVFVNGDKFENE